MLTLGLILNSQTVPLNVLGVWLGLMKLKIKVKKSYKTRLKLKITAILQKAFVLLSTFVKTQTNWHVENGLCFPPIRSELKSASASVKENVLWRSHKQTAIKNLSPSVKPGQPKIGLHKMENHTRRFGRSAPGTLWMCKHIEKPSLSPLPECLSVSRWFVLCAIKENQPHLSGDPNTYT